jgi:ABC-2 type transport system permease protein
MGVLTLVLNRAFGQSPGLLVMVLILGAMLSATLGVLLGAFIKDINTLFTVIKAGGLFLYAPAIVYLFPKIPEWVGRIFPTYYMIQPVVEITQKGAGWQDIAPEISILVLLILLMLGVITAVVRRAAHMEGTLNLA